MLFLVLLKAPFDAWKEIIIAVDFKIDSIHGST